jgi:hypothetical protein
MKHHPIPQRLCPTCHEPKPDGKFFVVRDGVRLPTRPCADCIATANVQHNREQHRRQR